MTRKRRRLIFVLTVLLLVGGATGLAALALNSNLAFFKSPSELVAERAMLVGQRLRIGGLVEDKSVLRDSDGRGVSFRVTDGKTDVPVAYTGILPDLFREGQGVVAEGRLRPDGVFAASSVLAKHDEKYMPPEVAEALKKAGRWQEGSTAPAPSAAK